MQTNNDNKNIKNTLIILLLLLITLIAVCVCVWAIFFRSPEVILAPDYAPPETEEYAQPIPGDSEDKMQSEEGGGSVNITYSDEVTISLSENKAYMLFSNPGRSNQNMILRLVIKDEVIVQSGVVEPGYRINEIGLEENSGDKLAVGGYDGSFEIYYYNPDSNEKAVVNTVIPVRIEVCE